MSLLPPQIVVLILHACSFLLTSAAAIQVGQDLVARIIPEQVWLWCLGAGFLLQVYLASAHALTSSAKTGLNLKSMLLSPRYLSTLSAHGFMNGLTLLGGLCVGFASGREVLPSFLSLSCLGSGFLLHAFLSSLHGLAVGVVLPEDVVNTEDVVADANPHDEQSSGKQTGGPHFHVKPIGTQRKAAETKLLLSKKR